MTPYLSQNFIIKIIFVILHYKKLPATPVILSKIKVFYINLNINFYRKPPAALSLFEVIYILNLKWILQSLNLITNLA